MRYESFEELPVWKDAIELAAAIFSLTADEDARLPSGLRDQIERAVTSISNNIAEGFERGTTQELIHFLYIARGSSGEVRSMLHLLARVGLPSHLVSNLKSRSTSISRQLGGWIEHLKNSPYKGVRYRTDADRRADEQARRRDAFLAKLEEAQENAAKRPRPMPDDRSDPG